MKPSLFSISAKLLAIALMTGISLNSQANINSLCNAATPCTVSGNVVAGQQGNVSIHWQGSVSASATPTGAAPSVSVSSSAGAFYAGNQMLGIRNTSLQKTVTISSTTQQSHFAITENLPVSAAISTAAADAGASAILYRRQFSVPGGGVKQGEVSIPLTHLSPAPEPVPVPEPEPTPAPAPAPEPGTGPRTGTGTGTRTRTGAGPCADTRACAGAGPRCAAFHSSRACSQCRGGYSDDTAF